MWMPVYGVQGKSVYKRFYKSYVIENWKVGRAMRFKCILPPLYSLHVNGCLLKITHPWGIYNEL